MDCDLFNYMHAYSGDFSHSIRFIPATCSGKRSPGAAREQTVVVKKASAHVCPHTMQRLFISSTTTQ